MFTYFHTYKDSLNVFKALEILQTPFTMFYSHSSLVQGFLKFLDTFQDLVKLLSTCSKVLKSFLQ